MDLKDRVANVPIVFVLTTITAGFIAGWTAHGSVLLASGFSSISGTRLQHLRRTASYNTDGLSDQLDELQVEKEALSERLLKNRPMTGNSITDVRIVPPHPGKLAAGESVAVNCDFKVNPNEKAWLTVEPEGKGPLIVYPMMSLHGSGHVTDGFTGKDHAEVDSVVVQLRADDNVILVETHVQTKIAYR
jgi:hypothetical protein